MSAAGACMELAQVDALSTPPRLRVPERFNAAYDLVERNLRAGRAAKLAYIDDSGRYTYAELAARIHRCASALQRLGLHMEQRVMLCLKDGIDFPTAFLGAIHAGIVPIPVNTLLSPADYAYMLHDSRAHTLIVSGELVPQLQPILGQSPFLKHVLVAGAQPPSGMLALREALAAAETEIAPAPTMRDEPCFWLYSSGSTGAPKGTVHVHSSLIETAALYAQATLGLTESDVVLSAAKLFFAYGLGNALTFPLAVGATAVLMAERPTPASIGARLRTHRPTVFSGVPTLFAALLASNELPAAQESSLRLCNCAGEALPEDIARRWRERMGIDIVDGIGSTEMLHIFISNRPGRIRHGTLGIPVPGFEAKIVDEDGAPVVPGEVGDLWVRGSTSAKFYWNNRERSRSTFLGHWTRTGDRCRTDANGDYVFAGRADDMLKVGGIYVSPIEVESALIAHPAVHEAAVVGREDADHLVKPAAYVVLAGGFAASEELAAELKAFVKSRLAPYKYPRWIEFLGELPKTATGKIQRFKLRAACHPTR
ncbi:MAG TPA: benzoate-CoA ligase family protein [Steroidobacteraceae bacterium]|nr:benzoate-CoA ligase family protein [Steroidobacteraceae bacterium]